MTLSNVLPRALVCALGVALSCTAHANQFKFSGNFSADNSVYEVAVDTLVSQSFTFKTTSFGKGGGFVPVLTLFNAAGQVVANDGSGTGNASITQKLAAGDYELFLTEFPNVAIGNLGDGFLFAGDPTATGDQCGVKGGMFLNTTVAPCTQLGSNFDLTVNSAKAATVVTTTPEPSSLLLMLFPASGLLWMRRRQNA